MMKFMKALTFSLTIVVAVAGLASESFAQKTPNQRDVHTILRSLNSKVDDLRYSLRYGLRNSAGNDSAENDVVELGRQIKSFESNFNAQRENADDVLDVLNTAKVVSDFLKSNKVNNTVQKDWTEVRTLLDRLASNYSVSWNWNSGGNTTYRSVSRSNSSLTGTYRLDSNRTDQNIDVVSNANLSDSDRRDLEEKLNAPEQLAIEVRGNQVTLASSNASAVTFSADGRTRTENSNGKTISVRALMANNQLTVSSIGGESDYTIIFDVEDGGQSLKVTRRVTTGYLNQTVFADSFYTKTDSVARLGIDTDPDSTNVSNTDVTETDNSDSQVYSTNDPTDVPNSNRNTTSNTPTTRNVRNGNFIVPNGTMVTGVLENDLTTKISQNNDRFRMTVQSPDDFRGAVIEGYITGVNRSGKVSGRSQITLNFEKITLRSGETYDFAGFLQSITGVDGKTIKVDTEGAARGDSQTKETAKRGGIGAGAGALIGAILGGGKGAAIGAIIGGSAGAGSVVVQGKDDLEINKGSLITVQSSAPSQ